MSNANTSESIEFVAVSALDGVARDLSVSPRRTVGDVLRAAGAGFHLLAPDGAMGSIQLRREGELLPLDFRRTVADVIQSGDRLIVEKISAGDRLTGSSAEADAFNSAAAKAAAESLSPDSGEFLRHARQVSGE
jgi:hypothetical protein